jgi:hypothetical protein
MKRLLLAALFAAAAARAAPAQETVVVLPRAPMDAYREALQGVCDGLGACPPTLAAESSDALPPGTRVVIALGGRAARKRYPSSVALVTALTPGYEARPRPGDGAVTRVRLTYAPDEFARKLLLLKPGAKRVVMLWSEPASGRFAESVRQAGVAIGLEAVAFRLADADDLPALLRSLPSADALWLSPDAALVTPTAFAATCEYARARAVMFFAPEPRLAERGAAAGLAPDFHDAGLRAAAAARDALAGRALPEESFPVAGTEPLAATSVSTKQPVGASR